MENPEATPVSTPQKTETSNLPALVGQEVTKTNEGENTLRQHASLISQAIHDSTPSWPKRIYSKHESSKAIYVDGLKIRVGYEADDNLDINFFNPRYGLIIGDSTKACRRPGKIEQELGHSTISATAPVLYELARQQNRLSPATIQKASELNTVTVATSTRPDGTAYTIIYLPEEQSNKMIRVVLDNFTAPIGNPTEEQVTQLREFLRTAEAQTILSKISDQALTMRVDDTNEIPIAKFEDNKGNEFRVEAIDNEFENFKNQRIPTEDFRVHQNNTFEEKAKRLLEITKINLHANFLRDLQTIRSLNESHSVYPLTATKNLLKIFSMDLRLNSKSASDEINALQEIIPQIVEVALRKPNLHKLLVDVIYQGYNRHQNRFRESARELVREIIHQAGTEGNAKEKALFIDNLLEALKTGFRKGSRILRAEGNEKYDHEVFPHNLYDDIDLLMSELYGSRDEFLQEKRIDINQFNAHHTNGDYEKSLSYLMLITLEQEHPGIGERLQKRYGISKFHRYPKAFLEHLNTLSPTNESRKVLLVMAVADHNNAMANPHSYSQYLKLQEYGIVPVLLEVNSLEEWKKLSDHTDEEFLKGVFQVEISGHGTSTGLTFGYENTGELTINNADRLIDIFKKLPNAKHLILDACSTGSEESYENLKDVVGMTLRIFTEAPTTLAGDLVPIGKDGLKYIPLSPDRSILGTYKKVRKTNYLPETTPAIDSLKSIFSLLSSEDVDSGVTPSDRYEMARSTFISSLDGRDRDSFDAYLSNWKRMGAVICAKALENPESQIQYGYLSQHVMNIVRWLESVKERQIEESKGKNITKLSKRKVHAIIELQNVAYESRRSIALAEKTRRLLSKVLIEEGIDQDKVSEEITFLLDSIKNTRKIQLPQ